MNIEWRSAEGEREGVATKSILIWLQRAFSQLHGNCILVN